MRMELIIHYSETHKTVIIDDIRYFPKGFSPSGNFPRVFSKVAFSKMWNFTKRQLLKSVLAAALGLKPVLAAALGPLATALRPHCSLRRLRGANLTFWKSPLGKLHIWEVVTWQIATWEVALEKMPLGMYLTPNRRLLDSSYDIEWSNEQETECAQIHFT